MGYFFLPDEYLDSVTELTAERLAALGIRALLLDVDCTLKRYSETDVSPEVRAWLDALLASGVRLCLLSNGRGKRIAAFAERVNLPFVPMAMKPSPKGCLRAIAEQGFESTATGMVGDQLFTDIWAGNRAGLRTFRVTPIHPEEEPWFARLKRPWEKIVLYLWGKRQKP